MVTSCFENKKKYPAIQTPNTFLEQQKAAAADEEYNKKVLEQKKIIDENYVRLMTQQTSKEKAKERQLSAEHNQLFITPTTTPEPTLSELLKERNSLGQELLELKKNKK
jgi:hypothetical protein